MQICGMILFSIVVKIKMILMVVELLAHNRNPYCYPTKEKVFLFFFFFHLILISSILSVSCFPVRFIHFLIFYSFFCTNSRFCISVCLTDIMVTLCSFDAFRLCSFTGLVIAYRISYERKKRRIYYLTKWANNYLLFEIKMNLPIEFASI